MKSTTSNRSESLLKLSLIIIFSIMIICFTTEQGQCERIKDIVEIQGLRSNSLSGVGLVVGLANTGDKSLLSRQMLTNLLRDSGLVLDPSDLTGGNIAVVMVTAELGPYDREGSRIDVRVSSVGDAKSLQGGTLLTTPLKGLDSQVYAVADGAVSIAGWTAEGEQASITKNHQTVGRIPNGAVVEKEELGVFIDKLSDKRIITLSLINGDFSTAQEISSIINWNYPSSAVVCDPGTVKVTIPDKVTDDIVAAFITDITSYDVTVDMPAVVVINEGTGTIVAGENVGISAVAISQGSLVVRISETERVSQPIAPFSDSGTTERVPETAIGVEEREAYLIPVAHSITVSELAKSLNAIGATPSDMISIFNALKQAGALQARLVIM